MLRRAKDGILRFTSHNDILRAVTRYSPEVIEDMIESEMKGKSATAPSLFAVQAVILDVLDILSQALSSCYSEQVAATCTVEELEALRATLLNRVRYLNTADQGINRQLDMLALVKVQERKLTVPATYSKWINTALRFQAINQTWQYVRNTKRDLNAQIATALCYCTYLTGVECSLNNLEGDEQPNLMIGTFNRRLNRLDFTADKVIGLFCDAFVDGNNGTHKSEYYMFVMDIPPSGRVSQPQDFFNVGHIAYNHEQLMHQLRNHSLQVL